MLINLALDAGEIMVASGAETRRVEDTMERILSLGGNNMPEALNLSTILIVSIHSPLSGSLTITRKVPERSINLQKICMVNSISRNFVNGSLTIEEAYQELAKVYHEPSFPAALVTACYGIASGGFTMMFLGTIKDGIGAFFTGIVLGIFMSILTKYSSSYFLNSLFGGVCGALFALLFFSFGIGSHYDIVIVGSIMPLFPGVTITNAIRDIMEGNFLSGTAKVMEAVLIAVAIATGVGSVLWLHGMIV